MISRKSIATLFLGILMSGQAFALDNEDFTVTQVDVTKTLGVVWLDVSNQSLTGQPTCNSRQYSLIACEISDDFCKSMVSLALAAKTTGGLVDFNYDGTCLGSFAMGSRFRLSD